MTELKWIRKGKVIETLERKNDDGEVIVKAHTESHPSINKAKRASRKLQIQEDGALGRGSLRVHY